MKRVVIIGGGITGLAAAHRVLERTRASGSGVQLTLIEAGSRTGGIVQTRERDGFLLELGPDSFISEKPAALELARRLGIESYLIETNENDRRSFIVRQGKLLPVPEGFHLIAPARFWPFVKSDIFSARGKVRMALDLVLPRRAPNGSATGNVEDESLAEFVRRRLGGEALDRMVQPMVGGIYTADPEQLSLRATMPRFLEMEREHRSLIRALRKTEKRPGVSATAHSATSGARYSLFLSFDRGMQLLTDKLEERIANFNSGISDFNSERSALNSEAGDLKHEISDLRSQILLSTSVDSLTLERQADQPPKWNIKTNQNENIIADAVCLALPAYVSARLLSSVDAQLASELNGISYASSGTINLAYKRTDIPHPLDGFGFVVPFIEKRTVMACTFSSVKFSRRAPEGHTLLRAFVGGALQPEVLELSEQELLSAVRADLRDLLGIEREPMFAEVTKWERLMPQYHLGHLERVARIEQRLASLPGLALAGNAYTGLGVPDCIRSGESAADDLVAAL